MSRRTIRAVDLLCEVQMLDCALRGGFADEVARWTATRDRKLRALCKTVAAFTTHDIDHLQKRSPGLFEEITERLPT